MTEITKNRNHLFDELLLLVRRNPDKIVFREMIGDSEYALSYQDLYRRVVQFSKQLEQTGNGETVLLLYSESVDFVVAFLAVQAVGKIPVPMFFPRSKRYFERLQNIIDDSNCTLALCNAEDKEKIEKGLRAIGLSLEIVSEDKSFEEPLSEFKWNLNPIAFIQYTSGSTGNPKGVVVSQKNLMHNQKLIQETFGCNEDSVILSWLPFYHDMGLIGNLLHTLFVGCSAVLLAPVDVVQNPVYWLENIERFKATHSGGPNFIYDKCVEAINTEEVRKLDLSSWKVAYNGSEPIKAMTIRKFTDKFSTWNFHETALKSCYGLAEATLIVSGGQPLILEETQTIASGTICNGISVVFYDQSIQDVNESIGEICIAGESVTEGYWKKDNTEYFILHKGVRYLRTGDIGQLINDQLVVLGRQKEIIIINGKNYYPYDIEEEVSTALDSIEANGVAITQIDAEHNDNLIVFAEVSRKHISNADAFPKMVRSIENIVVQTLGVDLHDIVLVSTRSLPRTSSGKIQRLKLRDLYVNNDYISLYQKKENVPESENSLAKYVSAILEDPTNTEAIDAYLVALIRQKLSLSKGETDTIRTSNLYELGVSSLIGVGIVHQINRDLSLQLEVSQVLEQGELEKIREFILSMLWLKGQPSTQEEIEL